jgi:MFS family permease
MLSSLNRNLKYLFVLNLAFGFSIQLISPLFPLYLSDIGADAEQNAWVISLGGLVATSLMFPAGLLLDKIGRRVLLIGSSVVNMVSIFLMSFATTWQQVLPLFMVYSATGALFMPARMAMITSSSKLENRSSIFGIMNTAWPIAGIIATLISGYLVETTGWNQVFILGSLINAVSILPGLRMERQNIPISSRDTGFRDLFHKEIASVLVIFFIYGMLLTTALGGINLIIPLYLESRFELSAAQIALFFTAQSALNLITQIPSGKIADRFGRKRTVLTFIGLLPFLYASWHFIADWKILLIVNSLVFGLWSMTWPATLTLLSDTVPSRLIGAAFGVNTTGSRLGFTIGPLIASYFYVNYFSTAPFLVSGVISLVAVLFAFRLRDYVKEVTLNDKSDL